MAFFSSVTTAACRGADEGSIADCYEFKKNAGDATPITRSMRYRPDDRKGKPLNHYVRRALQENNNKDEIVCCCFFGPLLTFSGLIST